MAQIGVEAYLTFSDFNGGKRASLEDFRADLVRYRREDIVRFCVFTNNAIYGLDPDPSRSAHLEIVRNACLPQTLSLDLAAKLISGTLFHRQQLLFVAKEALLICSSAGLPLAPGWNLTRLFLKANDQNVDVPVSQSIKKNETLALLANFIPVVEANRFSTFQPKFTRPLILLNRIMPTYGDSPPFDLGRLFIEATGFEPDEYFGLLFAALTASSRFKVEDLLRNPETFGLDSGFLIESRFTKEQLERFLLDVSANAEEYRATLNGLNRGLFDFTCFKDRPLFREGTKVFPVDFHFLGARCESALYWKSLERLSERDKDKFRSFWGDLFQRYINWMLARFVDGDLNKFTAEPTFDGTMEEVCDGLIVSGSSAVLLEYKGGLLAANAKYEGDLEKLRSNLEKKFVGTQDNRKGVLQLVNSIDLLFSGAKRVISGVDASNITKIYPVLVIHDDIGGAWMMNAYLNERFKTLSRGRFRRLSNRNGSKVTVTPLFCISVDHFEIVAEALASERLTDILEARYRGDRELRLAFLTAPNSVLGESARRIPKFLNEEMREFTNRLKEKFDRSA